MISDTDGRWVTGVGEQARWTVYLMGKRHNKNQTSILVWQRKEDEELHREKLLVRGLTSSAAIHRWVVDFITCYTLWCLRILVIIMNVIFCEFLEMWTLPKVCAAFMMSIPLCGTKYRKKVAKVLYAYSGMQKFYTIWTLKSKQCLWG